MRSRPLPVTVAAILLVLLSLQNVPWFWWYFFPGVEEPPAFVIYSGIVGLVAAVGLWMTQPWSLWVTIVVAALNFLFGVSGVILGPTAGIQAIVAVSEVAAVLIIVLVMLPTSRRALAAF